MMVCILVSSSESMEVLSLYTRHVVAGGMYCHAMWCCSDSRYSVCMMDGYAMYYVYAIVISISTKS